MLKQLDSEALENRLQQLVDEWISYGKWRRDYESYRKRVLNSENHQGDNVRVTELAAGDLHGKSVLDLGCGQGGLSVALAQKGYHVLPCDINRSCCEMALLRGLRHDIELQPVMASAHDLPFASGSFDVVLCQDVLEHVGDPVAALKEVRRVMKRDGICLLNFHHRYPTRDPHFRMNFVNWLPMPLAEYLIERKKRAPGREGMLTAECGQRLSEMHYYTCRAFRRLCKSVGLQCEILPSDFGGRKQPLKHKLRPFQNQYKAILKPQ